MSGNKKWPPPKNKLKKKKDNRNEMREINEYKFLDRCENRAIATELITTRTPPQTANELRTIRYSEFKNPTNYY